MPIYRARMKHNSATIKKLIQTGYDVFQFRRKLLNAAIAFGLILFGLYADKSMFTPWIALFVGCIMLPNLNAIPKQQASQVLQQIGKDFPKSEYKFYEKEFTFQDKEDPIPYKRLIRLIEDKQYMYLAENSAYMVDKGTVTGGSVSDLKTYLEIETGMKWSRPANLMSFKITDLFPRKDNYKGPRLK